jgi:hypothetical protein
MQNSSKMTITLEGRLMGTYPFGVFHTSLGSTLCTKSDIKSDLSVESVSSLVRLFTIPVVILSMRIAISITILITYYVWYVECARIYSCSSRFLWYSYFICIEWYLSVLFVLDDQQQHSNWKTWIFVDFTNYFIVLLLFSILFLFFLIINQKLNHIILLHQWWYSRLYR